MLLDVSSLSHTGEGEFWWECDFSAYPVYCYIMMMMMISVVKINYLKMIYSSE